jgi:hypothetical protein
MPEAERRPATIRALTVTVTDQDGNVLDTKRVDIDDIWCRAQVIADNRGEVAAARFLMTAASEANDMIESVVGRALESQQAESPEECEER